MKVLSQDEYLSTIEDICNLSWEGLTETELIDLAWAYYYFSIQFRESLEIACGLYPDDVKLTQLHREECDTDNLSPWPGVANFGERMNHDEFMRRLLELSPISEARRLEHQEMGVAYLREIRGFDPKLRALAISSYEDGGLETVFKAFLRASSWSNPLLRAFRWFLTEHIRFDSDLEAGHGSLSRHLKPDDRVLPLWMAFKALLLEAVPRLTAGRLGSVAHEIGQLAQP